MMRLAIEGHQNQYDKAGYPYVYHPFRLALMLRFMGFSPKYIMTAEGHDLVEDVYKGDLTPFREAGIPDDVIEAIALVSNIPKRDYQAFIDDIVESGNPLAIVVKWADMQDNMSPSRMGDMEKSDPERAAKMKKKYAEAWPKIDAAYKALRF
jgi:(p)ppGpp synthase/HD superfamily hydrolase